MSRTFYRQLISLLYLFVASGAVTAQNSNVLFFNEVDTMFQKVRVGQEVEVGYYSTYEIENLSAPQWNNCGAEQLSGPHNTSSSRTSVVNGQMQSLTLKGINYKVRFDTPGWVTLPLAIATINGKEMVCTPMKLRRNGRNCLQLLHRSRNGTARKDIQVRANLQPSPRPEHAAVGTSGHPHDFFLFQL